jgi:pimeloyl-ACP methyl ester carboxylesterase
VFPWRLRSRRDRQFADNEVGDNGPMLASRPLVLHTADGLRLAATHWDPGVRDVGCVVAHGFTMHSNRAPVRRICRAIAGQGIGVIAPDFRGHGRSGGYVTAGADEVHDVAAAVAWLRNAGYARVAVLGWSMGGAAVLRYAGLGGDADAVVSVSAAGTWFERGTRSMRVLHWAFETRAGRATTRVLKRTRISAEGWPTVPEAPAEVAGAIAPRPLLVVHGELDRYLPVVHAERIAAAAPTAEVWIEPDMGHAEIATTEALAERIAGWVLQRCRKAAVDTRA